MVGLKPLCPVQAVVLSGSYRGIQGCHYTAVGRLWWSQEGPGSLQGERLSWLSGVISLDPACHGRVAAHDTRGVSTSVAMLHGVAVEKICESARWSSSCAFAKYYLRDVGSGSFSSAVLGTAGLGPL